MKSTRMASSGRALARVAGLVLGWGLGLGFATPAAAEPGIGGPASVLVFPVVQSGTGRATVVSVTNVNRIVRVCSAPFHIGDVSVRYTYVRSGAPGCPVLDRLEFLTPGDTLAVIAGQHAPGFGNGFLYVEVLDPETNRPIDFDVLIGSATVYDTSRRVEWAYLPYAFRGYPNGSAGAPTDSCGRPVLDAPGDPDADTLDFDGVELDAFPTASYLDHFEGTGSPASAPGLAFDGRLWVMAANLSGPTGISVTALKNNERPITPPELLVQCHGSFLLSTLSAAFSQSGLAGDATELNGIAYGWLTLRTAATAAPVLAVYFQEFTRGQTLFASARNLQVSGSRAATLPRF